MIRARTGGGLPARARAFPALALAGLALLAPLAAAAQERVVIAGGDLTEIAFALGAGDRVIAVDTTSNFPPEAAALPRVGYLRALPAEGILAQAPDLMLAGAEAGPPAVLEQLRAAGLAIGTGPSGTAADIVPRKMQFVADALGLSERAAPLIAEYQARMTRLAGLADGLATHPRVLFILALQEGAPLVAGAGTEAEEMIRLASGVNAVEGIEGYRPMTMEAIIAARPDAVLMMSDFLGRYGGAQAILARPDIAQTPAGQAGRLIAMDGMLLVGFGPRTPEAVRALMRALHPEDADRLGL
ncbi:hemin ABC transporter substrate-binding protein [Paroceanicella profunda]|uniref:Hemin ABC transporter substrate-binding protein n=1 Tax=Paroceanicella profunda TaxID=2579971 RepID=A0A5B8FU34_9RHOB|nr:ABC transporter substrate-binding protein [Paroceanicella profunda]QDL91895.1 hemin ABC transporter substrate-binding protein [Paroceanicella profunda]